VCSSDLQTLSLGLIGEIIIFTHARNIRDYKIAEVIRGPRLEAVPAPPETDAERRSGVAS